MRREYVGKEVFMVFQNKLGINDAAELARMEEKISKKRAAALFESGYLDDYEAGTFQMFAAIHKYLFEQIYDFAGKVRTFNIASRYASFLCFALTQISSTLYTRIKKTVY